MVSGAMISTAKKASPKASPDSALITPHTPSEETQTLKKKGLALTVPHDTSVEVSRSSMRDSRQIPQTPLYIEAEVEQGSSGVAQGVARMQLSQVVALLIERWDELDPHSIEEILRRLE